jgi:hypothetical protein
MMKSNGLILLVQRGFNYEEDMFFGCGNNGLRAFSGSGGGGAEQG